MDELLVSGANLILSVARLTHSSSPSSYNTKCLSLPSYSPTLPENLYTQETHIKRVKLIAHAASKGPPEAPVLLTK